jgi:hypothetical protein
VIEIIKPDLPDNADDFLIGVPQQALGFLLFSFNSKVEAAKAK